MSAATSRIGLVGNGSTLNRGCEAIERGTFVAFRDAAFDGDFAVASFGADTEGPGAINGAPVAYRLPLHDPDPRFGAAWWRRMLRGGRGSQPAMGDYRGSFGWLDRLVDDCEVFLLPGGDNYTMDYGPPEVFFALNDHLKKRGKRIVLWGASVGPFGDDAAYTRACAERLREVDLILAREDDTVEYLESIGVVDNVRRVSDPAFLMLPEEPPAELVADVDCEGAIGFNFSPLFGGFVGGGTAWRDICVDAVQRAAQEFDAPVVLVPHVTLASSNDWLFMRDVAETVGRPDRVALLPPGLSAPQTKALLGRMAAFAGTRMHSTVGAMSMGVPTLGLSYSRKSIGIARDVYGEPKHLLTAGDMTAEGIVAAVHRLLEDGQSLRAGLAGVLPAVQERARVAARLVLEQPSGS